MVLSYLYSCSTAIHVPESHGPPSPRRPYIHHCPVFLNVSLQTALLLPEE